MYMVCSKLFGKAEIWTANKDSRGVHVCRYTLTHKLLDGCTLMSVSYTHLDVYKRQERKG